jgi:hypothetical protein
MWEAVRYDDVDYYEDRWALDALIAAVSSEMQFSLSKKRTAKVAWDAIAAARISSVRTRKTTLQALRKEWENLAFKTGEDVDDFALRLNTLQQKMVQFGHDTYGEERAVEKLFRCVPEKYKQIARSIESLLDLSTMSSRCGIVRWRTFSATSRCQDWPHTIWRRSCILRATTVSLGPSQRPRDTRHGVSRCSQRWTQLRRTAPGSLLISLMVTARSPLSGCSS